MKTLQLAGTLLLTVLFLTGSAFTISVEQAAGAARWQLLGQRKIDRKLDRDEIFVTAKDGVFSAIKLSVRRSAINMHRFVIHFRNGDTKEVKLRQNIPAGGASRVIDLPGNKRVIQKVVFWYDTKGLLNNKAVLQLYGRR